MTSIVDDDAIAPCGMHSKLTGPKDCPFCEQEAQKFIDFMRNTLHIDLFPAQENIAKALFKGDTVYQSRSHGKTVFTHALLEYRKHQK